MESIRKTNIKGPWVTVSPGRFMNFELLFPMIEV